MIITALLLFILVGSLATLTHQASAQSVTPAVLSVSPPQSYSTVGQSFQVDIAVYLPSQDNMSGYEVYLRYNNTVLNATGVVEGNLFPPSQAYNITYCLNGVGTGCTSLDAPNVVHYSQASAYATPGGSSYTVFTVQFSVIKAGSSPLELFNSTLESGVESSTNVSQSIPFTTVNGVYSTTGLTAFFNVGPSILIVGRPVTFDASDTFNPSNKTLTYNQTLVYKWDFGDGFKGGGLRIDHNYTSIGSYYVTLNVTDGSGSRSTYSSSLDVVSPLGQIQLSLDDQDGYAAPVAVTVRLYNQSQLVGYLTVPANQGGPAVFSGLSAGTYLLSFNGTGVTPMSKGETVIAGWTTVDNVVLTVHVPPPPVNNDLGYYILVAGVLGGIGLGGVAAVQRRRRKKA
jgi:hypothetical protein